MLCFDLKGHFICEYPSITDTAKAVGINDGTISNCLKGGCKTAAGCQWKRMSNPLFKNGIIDIPPVEKITGWMRKEVMQFDLKGKYIRQYPSVMAAARGLNIGISVIRNVIYGGGLTAGGYQWRSINDPLFEEGVVDIEPLGEHYPKAKALLQYDLKGKLKEEFRTIRDAVKKSGVSRHLILKCAQGERESTGNYTWKFKNPEKEKK
ncbi:NUMOD1 domain-containing DNA-binding protein [Acidobacteriota bacterium]